MLKDEGGYDRRHGWLIVAALLLLVVGCDESGTSIETEPGSPRAMVAAAFDPSTAQAIRGRVTWPGPVPQVPPFETAPNPLGGAVLRERQRRPNPHQPMIDPQTRGVTGAVVYLRGVDLSRSKAWDWPPVRVEQRDCRFHLLQGSADTTIGFVRRGDRVAMVSRDPHLHALHAGGAAFFTLSFPDPDQSLERSLGQTGVVELSSAAGYYWMRAYLFVDEHPYFARTDAQGRFVLEGVPPGSYELCCWLPNWRKARHERDPESGLVTRVSYAAPMELSHKLTVGRGAPGEVEFDIGVKKFPAMTDQGQALLTRRAN